MYGLVAVGVCLILGLFTPLAALGGAAYLHVLPEHAPLAAASPQARWPRGITVTSTRT